MASGRKTTAASPNTSHMYHILSGCVVKSKQAPAPALPHHDHRSSKSSHIVSTTDTLLAARAFLSYKPHVIWKKFPRFLQIDLIKYDPVFRTGN